MSLLTDLEKALLRAEGESQELSETASKEGTGRIVEGILAGPETLPFVDRKAPPPPLEGV